MEPAKEVKLYPVEDSAKKNQYTGFICLYRSVKNHSLWKKSKKKSWFEAWVDLLMMANHDAHKEPVGYDLIQLKRGQVLTSQDRLSKEWRWDRGAVRSFLTLLEKDAMITLNTTSKYTMITICNYSIYNDIKPTKQHQVNIKSTSSQHIQPLEQLEQYSTPPSGWLFSHNGFFDRQLEKNKDQSELDKYRKLVEFLHEKDEEGELKFKNVLSLSKQISYKDYVSLKATEKEMGLRTLKEVLESMENKKDLSKDYKNVYLTANSWLKNEFKKK